MRKKTDTNRDASAELPPIEEELLLEEVVSEIPSASGRTASGTPAGGASTVPRTPAEVFMVEAAMRSAPGRDEIACAALALARRHVAAAALFVVQRGVAAGLRAEADDEEIPVDGLLVPADGESVFAAPLVDGKAVRWGISRHPVDVRVLRAMGRESAADRMLLPISIRGRVVNLLYVDNGADAIAVTAAAALHALAGVVAESYERLLVARKQSRA